MKKSHRNFSDEQIKKLAEEYANSEFTCAAGYFAKRENVSRSTIYKILHRAVSEGLVSESTYMRMRDKAMANAQAYGGEEAALRSCNVYSQLYQEMKRQDEKKQQFENERRLWMQDYGIPDETPGWGEE